MSLLHATWNHLCAVPHRTWGLVRSFLVASAIETCMWVTLKHADAAWFIPAYCLLYLAELKFHRNVVFHQKLSTKHAVENEVLRTGWEAYGDLSLEDKMSVGADDFRSKLNDAKDAVCLAVDWGLHEMFVVAKMFAILFLVSGQRASLVAMAAGGGTVYAYLFQDAESAFRRQHKQWKKELRGKSRAYRQRTSLLLYGHTDINDVDEVLLSRSELQATSDRAWNRMASVIDVTNLVNLGVLVVFNRAEFADPVQAVMLMTLFAKFSTATKWMLRFMHSFQRGQDAYDEYLDVFLGASTRPLPPQRPFPCEVTVKDVAIERKDFRLALKSPFTLRHGDRVLVTGPSGGGKTTLLHALQGRVEGLSMDDDAVPIGKLAVRPDHYLADFVELHDNLRALTFSHTSIRELCTQRKGDTFDESLARRCLELCRAKEWGDRFGADDDIANKMSTGEKGRVVMALLVLYPTFHFNRRNLVLDEPEAGLDPPLAYAIVENITSAMECANKTIFIISHLERIGERVAFQKHLHVENGVVAPV